MDTLVQEYSVSINSFDFEHHLNTINQEKDSVNSFRTSHAYRDSAVMLNDSSPLAQSTTEEYEQEEADYSDAILNYISQMLMEEEDLGHMPCMFYDCMALQATEKYFYDALSDPKTDHSSAMGDASSRACSSQCSESSADGVNSWNSNPVPVRPTNHNDASSSLQPNHQSFSCSDGFLGDGVNGWLDLSVSGINPRQVAGAEGSVVNHSTGKRHHREESDSAEEMRGNKLLASSANESDYPLETYDDELLCSDLIIGRDEDLVMCSIPNALNRKEKSMQSEQSKRSKQRSGDGKRNAITRELVDLGSLLMQCAEAVTSYDSRSSVELLKRIRQHSSPSGDASERLAHYFANALEARLAGTGTALYASFDLSKYPAAQTLKAYQAYIMACPFKRLSNYFANKSIKKVASGATTLHIIDFGILYGYQWPCLIQALSERRSGPPNLRITGIDFPQPGFRPAGRVEETGRRLGKYCKRFNVPFEFNAIAKKWDTIKLEDLLLDRNEVLAVNCLYRLENVPDETVVSSSPRDAVLKLIKRIKPDIFVHGVTNGTYKSPFFLTRFKEAFFHFSSLFDMIDATLPRESHERMLYEQELLGRDTMNVIACEGTERVERSETYKQWQVRNIRAGFKQIPLDEDLVNSVRDKVKKCYHKDFIVDEDGNWMLQGWKGKVIHALSCWKPNKKHQ